MENTTTVKTPGKFQQRLKNFLKYFGITMAVLIVAGFIGHWVWVASGTSEWEKALEQDGVVVHTLKQPGKFVLQMRATKRIKSKLAAFVSVMQDVDAMCTHGCYEAKILTREDDHHLLSTFTRFDLPAPLQDREWVLENHFSQHPETKEILYRIKAVPHIVPENDGYVRIKHFNNTWRFIPSGNGEVEVVWEADMDQGGYVVNMLFNLASADAMRNSFLEIEKMVQQDKYQRATYEFVDEVVQVTAER